MLLPHAQALNQVRQAKPATWKYMSYYHIGLYIVNLKWIHDRLQDCLWGSSVRKSRLKVTQELFDLNSRRKCKNVSEKVWEKSKKFIFFQFLASL